MTENERHRTLPEKIEILMAVDDNYRYMFVASVASILKNASPDEELVLHILDGGISEETRQTIDSLNTIRPFERRYYHPNVKLFERRFPNLPNYATFFRLVVAQNLPETTEKVIYLDSDVLVLSSLRELWNVPLNGSFCAAVYDVHHRPNVQQELGLPLDYRYFNAGVLLIDLKRWREENLASIFLDIAVEREGKLPLADQDILNVHAASHGYCELDGRWNQDAADIKNFNSLAVLHYMWRFWMFPKRNSVVQQRLLDEYIALTPYRKFPHRTVAGRVKKAFILFYTFFTVPKKKRRARRIQLLTEI